MQYLPYLSEAVRAVLRCSQCVLNVSERYCTRLPSPTNPLFLLARFIIAAVQCRRTRDAADVISAYRGQADGSRYCSLALMLACTQSVLRYCMGPEYTYANDVNGMLLHKTTTAPDEVDVE